MRLLSSLPADFAVWMGPILPPSYYKDLYKVDEVLYTDDIPTYFSEFKPEVIYVPRVRTVTVAPLPSLVVFGWVANR